jgi:UDP-2,3-diacylglucosamine pyrophosphatase LpxH
LLLPPSDYDLLIVSDLHLGEGRQFSRNEDFFFDGEFARFLAYHRSGTPEHPNERKWHLIINGDFVDFLRVVTVEGAPVELIHESGDKKYGLGWGAEETVFKLGVVMKGHLKFFETLAEFVAEGHIVSICKGNHDPEFFYPAVQAAFVTKLRNIYAEKLHRENDPNATAKLAQFEAARQDHAIRFRDWFYHEKGVLWVEHGNQYDKLNSWEYWLEPLLPTLTRRPSERQDEIELPWGSLFVRYLFNRVEEQARPVDNIKPMAPPVGWFRTRYFCLVLKFFFTDGCHMLKKMARAWKRLPPGAYDLREQHHKARLAALAADAEIPLANLTELDRQHSPNVLRDPSAVLGKFVRLLVHIHRYFERQVRLNRTPQHPRQTGQRQLKQDGHKMGLLPKKRIGSEQKTTDDVAALAQQAAGIGKLLGVRYVAMGHTHQTDRRAINERGEYFNTGTWTKVRRSEEERQIAEESQLVFLQLVRRPALKASLLQWNDAADEPCPVKLFKSPGQP